MASPENKPFHKKHYPGLDALRGVAILLVVFFHYFAFPIGWIGVDLFFVLSGFLITQTLLELKEDPNYFRQFFIRRILRIFPVYFLTLIVFFSTAPYLFSEKGPGTVYAYYTQNEVWFWTFMQNWLFIKKGLPPEPYLQHFWSLAIEEQFYLCWPFLVLWVNNVFILRKLVTVIFFAGLFVRLAIWFYPVGHDAFYYHTLARIDSLAAGAFLSTSVYLGKRFLKKQVSLIVAAFAAMLFLSYLLFRNWRLDNAVFATAGYSVSALFFAVVCQWLMATRYPFPNKSALVFFGRISYGLYVYHIPVLLVVSFLFQKYAAHLLRQLPLPAYFTAIVSLGVSTGLSLISFKLVEQPALKLKKKLLYPATKIVSNA